MLAPRRNEADLEDIPEPLRAKMEFVWVGEVGEVFAAALSRRPLRPADARVCSSQTDCGEVVWHKPRRRPSKAQQAALKARYNPYVQRLVEDEDLRDNIVQAYESARKAAGRLSNGKSPAKQIFDDKKLQKDVKKAAESFKDASVALRESPKKKRSGGIGKLLFLGVAGAGVALAVSEPLAQEGARRAVRQGGGVRVHLDDHRLLSQRDGRLHHLKLFLPLPGAQPSGSVRDLSTPAAKPRAWRGLRSRTESATASAPSATSESAKAASVAGERSSRRRRK